ncbi:hypothetical protein [Halomonas stenophila]|uniref:Uncharacterized protein n=1 Tax=Halomonas stenophila TaxID=795312 RepID=A0A7W5EQP6_9GAMM|nr:hypothetical protein [Halomonas stenophila]MBB3229697.1 hypothetical protein [Halomonas stenophila]
MCQDENSLTYHVMSAGAQSVSPEVRRAHAVSAATELIAIRLRSSTDGNLEEELEKLDSYADTIQAALRHSRLSDKDREGK